MNVNKKRRELLTYLINQPNHSTSSDALDKFVGATESEAYLVMGELVHSGEIEMILDESKTDEEGRFIAIGARICKNGILALSNQKYKSEMSAQIAGYVSLICTIIVTVIAVFQFNSQNTEIEVLKKEIEGIKLEFINENK